MGEWLEDVGKWVEGVSKAIGDGIQKVVDGVEGAINRIVDGVKDAVDSVLEGIRKAIQSILEGIWKAIQQIIQGILDAIDRVLDGLWNGIKRVLDGIFGRSSGADSATPTLIRLGHLSHDHHSYETEIRMLKPASGGVPYMLPYLEQDNIWKVVDHNPNKSEPGLVSLVNVAAVAGVVLLLGGLAVGALVHPAPSAATGAPISRVVSGESSKVAYDEWDRLHQRSVIVDSITAGYEDTDLIKNLYHPLLGREGGIDDGSDRAVRPVGQPNGATQATSHTDTTAHSGPVPSLPNTPAGGQPGQGLMLHTVPPMPPVGGQPAQTPPPVPQPVPPTQQAPPPPVPPMPH